jgi:excisionase family DNA binding protein
LEAQEPTHETFIRDAELARRLHVNRVSVKRWREAGKLPAVKIGGSYFIPESWVRSMETGAWAALTEEAG